MSIPILILAESGKGKTASLRNLDPAASLLIKAVNKELPFSPNDGWVNFNPETKKGNVYVTDRAVDINTIMHATKKKIIVLDDFQYVLANELMRRWEQKGYDKFSEIGYNGWNIITQASQLAPDVRVYILAHSVTDEAGTTKIKTPGKLLDTYSIEGMFSIVLRAVVMDGAYLFTTHNNGSDTVKTPMGMFKEDTIPNDLALLDARIQAFYPRIFQQMPPAAREATK